MWTGRFEQPTAEVLQRFSESISFDWRLWKHDIQGSCAHAAALQKAGLISQEELVAIQNGLNAIGEEISAGKFPFRIEREDIHMNIEAELTARIGPAGAKLHTARSRNDQVALDIRLYLRDACSSIQRGIRALQASLVHLADNHADVVIPGYTHLQRAQPVAFAHHLLAYVEMLERDHDRYADGARRMNVLPLGSGAIAGSTIPLDRQFIANQLGFTSVSTNSMDAVSDRDFAVELLASSALLGIHLSRLSEDVILWSSAEFHFLTLSDAFTTGSSLMPQKKNPDVAELTRGKSGRLIGNLTSLLTLLKGLPLTYNRDMQEDKEPVFDTVDTVLAILEVYAPMMREAKIHRDSCASAVSDPMLLATDLADYLVLRGVPFRQAHEHVGRSVALCNQRGCTLKDLSLADYQSVTPHFGEDTLSVLDLDRSMRLRTAIGAPSPDNVRAQLQRWKTALA
jgi:argininosuccinate lyase